MTNDENPNASKLECENNRIDYPPLSPLEVLFVTTTIFIPITLFIGMIGGRLPNVVSPFAFLMLPFIPAIVFPYAAVPLGLTTVAACAVAIRRGSLPALAGATLTFSIINGIGLRIYLSYMAQPT